MGGGTRGKELWAALCWELWKTLTTASSKIHVPECMHASGTMSTLDCIVSSVQVLEGDEKADALCVRGQWLLLDFLLRGPPAYFPAAMFHLCRMFSEEVIWAGVWGSLWIYMVICQSLVLLHQMRELVRGDEDEGAPLESDVLVEEQGAEILAKYRQMAGGQIDAVPCQFQEVRLFLLHMAVFHVHGTFVFTSASFFLYVDREWCSAELLPATFRDICSRGLHWARALQL